MHDRLVIVGAKGHGKVVADIAQKIGRYQDIGFLDDDTTIRSSLGFPVLGNCSDFAKFCAISDVFVAIGDYAIRRRMLQQLSEMGAEIPVLVHPQAIVGQNVTLGIGTVIMAGAVINVDTKVGRGCIINTCASVDHDCAIADYVHVAVGAHLAGNVRVGQGTWIGAGAVVKNNIDICNESVIGIGAAVVKNIEEPGTYIGVPAKRMYAEE